MERKKEREVVHDASPVHCLSLANSPSGESVFDGQLLCYKRLLSEYSENKKRQNTA